MAGKTIGVPISDDDHSSWHERSHRAGYRSTAQWIRDIVNGRIGYDDSIDGDYVGWFADNPQGSGPSTVRRGRPPQGARPAVRSTPVTRAARSEWDLPEPERPVPAYDPDRQWSSSLHYVPNPDPVKEAAYVARVRASVIACGFKPEPPMSPYDPGADGPLGDAPIPTEPFLRLPEER